VLFFKTSRRIQKSIPVQFLWEPIPSVETACHLGVILGVLLTCSAHVSQVRKKASQWQGVLAPTLTGEAACLQKSCAALQATPTFYDRLCMTDLNARCSQPCPAASSVSIQVSSHRAHQSTDWDFRLNISWCGEPMVSNCSAALTEVFRFFSAVRQMPGYNSKGALPAIPDHGGLQPKWFPQ
jgi:hypothetical protein